MKALNDVVIKTQRLVLTPVNEQDLDIYLKLLTNPETTKYLPGGQPFSREYICNYLPQKIRHWHKGYGTCIVTLRDQPETKIGYVGVEQIPDSNKCDIRYAVVAEFQGHGYAYEASKAILDFVFSSRLVAEVFGVAVKENTASVNLLKKLGMQPSNAQLYDSDDLITLSISVSSKR